MEMLEQRVLLSFPPLPIDPNKGEQAILDNAKKFEDKLNLNALDQLPIPFAVVAQAGGGTPVVAKNNPHSGAPMRVDVDVDSNLSTGKGGKDVSVEVSTELLLNGVFNPHLLMTIDRLGGAPYATDFQVLISFPFEAFNAEALPGAPNLFIGYKTTGPGGPDDPGGIAPMSEAIRFIPNVVGGSDHTVEIRLDTVGASNPLQFITGHFDGTDVTGILNADAFAAWVEQPPANITIGVDVANSAIFGGPIAGSIALTWDATSASKVVFDYLEQETGPLDDSDYNTTVTFNEMPTHEELSLSIDEVAETLTLSHRANQPIDEILILSERNDGLKIIGTLTDVPTEVDLTLGMAGTVILDVNDNTLDLKVEAIKEGGFLSTADFLGYDIGYAAVEVTDAPDLTAGFIPSDGLSPSRFGVLATNPGECIGSIALIIGDDEDLELPPLQDGELVAPWDDPNRHIFSLVDDGTHGTAAARLVDVEEATLDLAAADFSEALVIITCNPHPLTAYLRTTETSNIIPGHDVEITMNIVDVPAGRLQFDVDFPTSFSYTTDPLQGIDSVHIFGHIDTLNFDVDAGGLPSTFSYDFDPDSHLIVNTGNETLGHLAVRLWDEDGPTGLPGSGGLLGVPLRDARARVDNIPSFTATWSDDAGGTAIDFNTDANNAFIDGMQLALSTRVELTTALPVASPTSDHFLRFHDKEDAGSNVKRLGAGFFGIDQVTYNSNDATRELTLHYDANQDHQFVAEFDSDFGGRFFPAYDIDLTLTVDDVPQLWDFSTDFATSFVYTGSSGIDSVALLGVIDDTNDSSDNGTNVLVLALGLPSDFNLQIDPDTGIELVMNAPIELIQLILTSSNKILGSDYQLVEAAVTDIPARWSANWAGDDFVLETKDAGGNPSPLGELSARVSTSSDEATNAARLAIFKDNGPVDSGPILNGTSGGSRINYSPFLQEIDKRYLDSSGAGSMFDRLRDLYAGSDELDDGEDHAVAIIAGGKLEFASVQFSGFQKIAFQPDDDGGHFELKVPTPGLHPLFAGVKFGDEAITLQISNIPDSMVLDIEMDNNRIEYTATDDVDPSIDQIDVYYGPLPKASDTDTAVRAIMNDVPDHVLITWGFGFPSGSAAFDASGKFELLFLAQNGSSRVVGGLQLEDLEFEYDVFIDVYFDVDWFGPVPTELALNILTAKAGIDNDIDDVFGVATANPNKPGVDGFFSLYSLTGSPSALDPAGPGAAGQEYIPKVSFLMKDFKEFSLELGVGLELIPAFLSPEVELTSNLVGLFAFDFWAGLIDVTAEAFVEFGFLNVPDYTDNTPIHLVPLGSPNFDNLYDVVYTFVGFHGFGSHFDPFA